MPKSCVASLRELMLSLSVVVVTACGGAIGGGGSDGGNDGDADTGTSCGNIVCPDGTECVNERCMPIDPCRDQTCGPDEVCVDGECVSQDSDEDRDGYTIMEDCDDNDATIFPGRSETCRTGCGEGERTCMEDGTWSECTHSTDPCELPHAASACVDDACVITACADGWNHCDDSQENGCETSGDCGSTEIDVDDDGYNVTEDCDDDDPAVYPGTTRACTTGCGEGVLTCESDGTWSACEHPTNPCDLPNASSTCADGVCIVTACNDGWSNCDPSHENGCETQGPCGGTEVTCEEGLDCVLECSSLMCGFFCVADVCTGGAGAASDLVACGDELCDPICDIPNDPGCLPCLQSSCSEYYNACLNAEC